MREARWAAHRATREEARARTVGAAAQEIGELSDRDTLLVGVALYWAEGAKSKPYDRRESVCFVNSDPDVIRVYLSWPRLLQVEPERLRFRVMVHESADVPAIERFWADLVEVPFERFSRTTLKKHNPRTVRKNTGEHYRGCLVITVLRGAELYRRIEGWWYGIVCSAKRGHPE